MKFKINNDIWEVKEIDEDALKYAMQMKESEDEH